MHSEGKWALRIPLKTIVKQNFIVRTLKNIANIFEKTKSFL